MGIFPVSLALAVMLSGCDRIPLTPSDAIEAARPLGTPVKEEIGQSDEGTLYRWTVEARRASTWGQATGVIRRQPNQCPDGQLPEDVEHTPALDRTAKDAFSREYPAGTQFIVVRRCPPPPSFQFTFERRLDYQEGLERMQDRIEERSGGPFVRPAVSPVYVHEGLALHESVRNTLAVFSHLEAARCPEALRISYLSLGVQPQINAGDSEPDAFLAFIPDCTEGVKSEPVPPRPPPG